MVLLVNLFTTIYPPNADPTILAIINKAATLKSIRLCFQYEPMAPIDSGGKSANKTVPIATLVDLKTLNSNRPDTIIAPPAVPVLLPITPASKPIISVITMLIDIIIHKA